MTAKTPVSLLQEFCAKNRSSQPEFTLVGRGGPPHHPIFTYQVSCRGITGRGDGLSKQDAKHNAAKALLSILTNTLALDHVDNPYEDDCKENTVGALQDFCLTSMINIPRYEDLGSQGSPPEITFSFNCSVPPLSTTGSGRTKKQAKHHAAYLMLKEVEKNLAQVKLHEVTTKSDTLIKQSKAVDRLSECLEKELSFNDKPYVKPLVDVDFSNIFKNKPFSTSYKFNALTDEYIDELIDPVKYFEEMMIELSLEWKTHDLHVKPYVIGRMIALHVKHVSSATFIGHGESYPEALLKAILSALKWFATMKSG